MMTPEQLTARIADLERQLANLKADMQDASETVPLMVGGIGGPFFPRPGKPEVLGGGDTDVDSEQTGADLKSKSVQHNDAYALRIYGIESPTGTDYAPVTTDLAMIRRTADPSDSKPCAWFITAIKMLYWLFTGNYQTRWAEQTGESPTSWAYTYAPTLLYPGAGWYGKLEWVASYLDPTKTVLTLSNYQDCQQL